MGILNKSNEYRSIIIQAIKDAYSGDLKDVKDAYELETFSSRHSLARDLMNTNMVRRLDKDRFIIEKFNRGAHTFTAIYDKHEKSLYSIMKQKTFKDLQKSKNKVNIHYLEAFGFVNNDRVAGESQIMLFEEDQRLERIGELLFKMVKKEIVDEVKAHILVTFDIKNDELGSVVAFQLNSNLDIIDQESWNDYIPVEYEHIGASDLNRDETEEEYALEEDISIDIKGTDIQIQVK